MKFCRFLGMDGSRFGLVETRDGHDFIVSELGSPQMQVSGAGVPEQIVLPEIGSGKTIEEPFPLERAKLLIPFPIISKILCVGSNYAAHVRELAHEMPTEPLVFSKPPSALLAPGGEIVRPTLSKNVHYEGELGVLIGRRCHKMKEGESAKEYILGYSIVNDVTARDLQNLDRQWTRCQRFRHLLPLRPHRQHRTRSRSGVKVQTRVNGELHQDGNTRDMMFSIDRIVHYISQFCTLLPGDLIATGTPKGVGPLLNGDVVEVSIEGIGTLRNPVVDE